jgi:hypothetical protein
MSHGSDMAGIWYSLAAQSGDFRLASSSLCVSGRPRSGE